MPSAFLPTDGVARRLTRFAVSVVGHIHDGQAIASVLGRMLMLGIYVDARIKTLPAQKRAGFREVFSSGFSASGGILLIIIVLGSIYGGIASPAEAAAVSAAYAYLVSIMGNRDIRPLKAPTGAMPTSCRPRPFCTIWPRWPRRSRARSSTPRCSGWC